MNHSHHIIPKHEWKERFGNLDGVNDPKNLVTLTLEQHAQVHLLLYEQFRRWEDFLAYQGLTKQIGKEEATLIAQIKGGAEGGTKSKGKKQSLQSNQKRSASLKSRPKTAEHNRKNSLAQLGKIRGPYKKGKRRGMAEVPFSRGQG